MSSCRPKLYCIKKYNEMVDKVKAMHETYWTKWFTVLTIFKCKTCFEIRRCDEPGEPGPPPSDCDAEASLDVVKDDACGLLKSTNEESPFKDCVLANEQAANNAFDDCKFDYCPFYSDYPARQGTLCKAYEDFAILCEELTGRKIEWRMSTGCCECFSMYNFFMIYIWSIKYQTYK